VALGYVYIRICICSSFQFSCSVLVVVACSFLVHLALTSSLPILTPGSPDPEHLVSCALFCLLTHACYLPHKANADEAESQLEADPGAVKEVG